jgi:predicted small secreted protein
MKLIIATLLIATLSLTGCALAMGIEEFKVERLK